MRQYLAGFLYGKGSSGKLNNLNKSNEKPVFYKRRPVIIGIIIIMAIAIAAIALSLYFTLWSSIGNSENTESGGDGPDFLQIYERDEWNAQPPTSVIRTQSLPVNRTIILNTVTPSCHSQSACVYAVKKIQQDHIAKYSDIGYNFLVGGDGAAYVGRDWDKEGAHTKGYNKGSIGIAFIGDFRTEKPPNKQVKACLLLLERGVRLNKLTADYRLYGDKQLRPSESPGEELYKIIQTWPHWSEEIDAAS